MIMSGMVISVLVVHDYLLIKDPDIPESQLEVKAAVLYGRIHKTKEKYFPTPKQKPVDKLAKLRKGLR